MPAALPSCPSCDGHGYSDGPGPHRVRCEDCRGTGEGHCDGCDSEKPSRPYDVTNEAGEVSRASYCDDCASMAVGWGEAAAIVAVEASW